MHDATTTNPRTTHSHGAEGQVLRMVERETVRGNLPARDGGTAATSNRSNAGAQ